MDIKLATKCPYTEGEKHNFLDSPLSESQTVMRDINESANSHE